jgi:hypothetical protein
MDVQNAANGHLASLRVTEGVFPNDLKLADSPGVHVLSNALQAASTNVLIALCLISGARASTTYRVSRGRGVVGT